MGTYYCRCWPYSDRDDVLRYAATLAPWADIPVIEGPPIFIIDHPVDIPGASPREDKGSIRINVDMDTNRVYFWGHSIEGLKIASVEHVGPFGEFEIAGTYKGRPVNL
jgi:hypothetical protein